MSNLKIYYDASNLSTHADRMMRTGIQETVYRIFYELIAYRKAHPEFKLLSLPWLPSEYYDDLKGPPVAPHARLEPQFVQEIEQILTSETGFQSEEIWGIDLKKKNYDLSDAEILEHLKTSDHFFEPAVVDIGAIKKIAPQTKIYTLLYDITPILLPEYTDEIKAIWFEHQYIKNMLRDATKIFSISRHTTLDLKEYAELHEKKILPHSMISLCMPFPELPVSHTASLLTQWKLNPHQYLVFLGSLEPRKYGRSLLEGFECYLEQNPNSKLKLVWIGGTGWKNLDLKPSIQKLTYLDRFVSVGYRNDAEIRTLIESALGLVMLSHYEGFGIPAALATRLKTPVLTNLGTSLPEACADKAVYVDSFDPYSVASGILYLEKNHTEFKKNLHSNHEMISHWNWNTYTEALFNEVCF